MVVDRWVFVEVGYSATFHLIIYIFLRKQEAKLVS